MVNFKRAQDVIGREKAIELSNVKIPDDLQDLNKSLTLSESADDLIKQNKKSCL